MSAVTATEHTAPRVGKAEGLTPPPDRFIRDDNAALGVPAGQRLLVVCFYGRSTRGLGDPALQSRGLVVKLTRPFRF